MTRQVSDSGRSLELSPPQTKHERGGLWMLPFLALLWGSSYLWLKLLAEAVEPTLALFGRVLVAGAFLGIVLAARGGRLPPFGRMWFHIAFLGVFSDLLPLSLLLWAQQEIDSSMAAVLNATTPLFALLLAALLFRSERITLAKLGGVVLGFVGVVLLSGGPGGDGIFNVRVLAVLASSVCYGLGFAYTRRYVRGNPLSISVTQLLTMFPVISVVTLGTTGLDVGAVEPTALLAVVMLGIFSTSLSMITYYAAIERLGVTTTSLTSYLAPVVAVALGWLVLGERIGLVGLLGAVTIIGGVALASGLTAVALRAVRFRFGLDAGARNG
jgi:drug/metabolite transporter (DMT)-like permease